MGIAIITHTTRASNTEKLESLQDGHSFDFHAYAAKSKSDHTKKPERIPLSFFGGVVQRQRVQIFVDPWLPTWNMKITFYTTQLFLGWSLTRECACVKCVFLFIYLKK